MKKFFLFLFIFIFAFSLISCQAKNGDEENGKQSVVIEPSKPSNGAPEQISPQKSADEIIALSPNVRSSYGSAILSIVFNGVSEQKHLSVSSNDFYVETNETVFAYAGGVYYEKKGDFAFQTALNAEELSTFFKGKTPTLPAFPEESFSSSVSKTQSGLLFFTVLPQTPHFSECLPLSEGDSVIKTVLRVYFDQEYRLAFVTGEYTLTNANGELFFASLQIEYVALSDEYVFIPSAELLAYPRLQETDAASLIASLPHPGIGDYLVYQKTVLTDIENGHRYESTVREFEELHSQGKYHYLLSQTPLTSETYYNYIFANGIFYIKPLNSAYLNMPMTKEEFAEALGITSPSEDDDFTLIISHGFLTALEGSPLYKDEETGSYLFSLVSPASVYFGDLSDIHLYSDVSVHGTYSDADDALYLKISYVKSQIGSAVVTEIQEEYTIKGFYRDLPFASDTLGELPQGITP